jgi:hypothetical protein
MRREAVVPSAVATIPYTPQPVAFGQTLVAFQDSHGAGDNSVIECSITAGLAAPPAPPSIPFAGRASSLTSIGLDLGVAPSGSTTLRATASGNVFENALVVAAFSAAGSQALLRFYLEAFSLDGLFLGAVAQATPETIYDDNETFLGVNARRDQLSDVILRGEFAIAAGNQYRLWVDSIQNVYAQVSGIPEAVSNFQYILGPIEFDFS